MSVPTVNMKVPPGVPNASIVFWPDGSQSAVNSSGIVAVPTAFQSFALNSGYVEVLGFVLTPLTISTSTVAATLEYIPANYATTPAYADMTLTDGTKIAVPYFPHV